MTEPRILTPKPTPGNFPATKHRCVFLPPPISAWAGDDGEWGSLHVVAHEAGALPWIYICRCGEKMDLRGMFPDET